MVGRWKGDILTIPYHKTRRNGDLVFGEMALFMSKYKILTEGG